MLFQNSAKHTYNAVEGKVMLLSLQGLYALSMNLMDSAQAQFNAALEVHKVVVTVDKNW